MYLGALKLAHWCASSATSGGKGTARAAECRRIEQKLSTLKGPI